MALDMTFYFIITRRDLEQLEFITNLIKSNNKSLNYISYDKNINIGDNIRK